MNLKLLHLLSLGFVLVQVACTHTPSPQAPSSKQKSKSKRTVAVASQFPKTNFNNSRANTPIPADPIYPIPPIDPTPPGPHPEPPGYIPDPMYPETIISFPKTIRDSIVGFPYASASYGKHPADLSKFIDDQIANSMEWEYIKEFGIEGKIFIRLLIDVKGKVREVTFLKFTDKELEIFKNRLKTALLAMPNWTPAKNEGGDSVVSEYTFPFKIQID